MSPEDRIAQCRIWYSQKTRAELIAISKDPVYPTDYQLVAFQILDEMDCAEKAKSDKTEERRHIESLDASRGANRLAKWAIVIAISALIVSVIQTFW